MITPIFSPPSMLCSFPLGSERTTLRVSILDNGDLDFDVDEGLKERMAVLLEAVGLGVCIELARKESM